MNTAQALEALRPTLRRVARRFNANARGSLGLDDLEQVGAIEALKFLPKFDLARAPNGFRTLRTLVAQRAMRGMVQAVRLHSSSIRPSDLDQRAGVPRPVVEQIDEVFAESESESAEVLLLEVEDEREVRRAVHRLPVELMQVVAWVYGIGRPRRSVREIARRTGMQRLGVQRLLERGQRMLARSLARR